MIDNGPVHITISYITPVERVGYNVHVYVNE